MRYVDFKSILPCIYLLWTSISPAMVVGADTTPPAATTAQEKLKELTSVSLGERLSEARRQSQMLLLKRSVLNQTEGLLDRANRSRLGGRTADTRIPQLFEELDRRLKVLKDYHIAFEKEVALEQAAKAAEEKSKSGKSPATEGSQPAPDPSTAPAPPQSDSPGAPAPGLNSEAINELKSLVHQSSAAIGAKVESIERKLIDQFGTNPAIAVPCPKYCQEIADAERRVADVVGQLIRSIDARAQAEQSTQDDVLDRLDSVERQLSAYRLLQSGFSTGIGVGIPAITRDPISLFDSAEPLSPPRVAQSIPASPSSPRPTLLPPLSSVSRNESLLSQDYPLASLLYASVMTEGWSQSGGLKDFETLLSSTRTEALKKTDGSAVGQEIQSRSEKLAQAIKDAKSELAKEEALYEEDAIRAGQEFVRRDSQLNQTQINLYLVNAVYMMVGAITLAIVLLFAVVFVFRAGDFSKWILKDRVLIELLSMGFLLLTVIILGTARVIEAQGLSALLGTIAGYIFIRKAVDMASSRDIDPEVTRNPPPPPAVAGTPPQPPAQPPANPAGARPAPQE